MAEKVKREDLANEQTLKEIIEDTIDSICEKGNNQYPNICRYAQRTPDDKHKIITRVFDIMTEKSPIKELDEALSQVDEGFAWGE